MGFPVFSVVFCGQKHWSMAAALAPVASASLPMPHPTRAASPGRDRQGRPWHGSDGPGNDSIGRVSNLWFRHGNDSNVAWNCWYLMTVSLLLNDSIILQPFSSVLRIETIAAFLHRALALHFTQRFHDAKLQGIIGIPVSTYGCFQK